MRDNEELSFLEASYNLKQAVKRPSKPENRPLQVALQPLYMHRSKISVEKQTHPYSPRRRQNILQIMPKIRTMDVQNGMEKRHGKERDN